MESQKLGEAKSTNSRLKPVSLAVSIQAFLFQIQLREGTGRPNCHT